MSSKELTIAPDAQAQAQEKALVAALKSSFYPGAADASIAMVLDYCKAAGLDPMTRPVHIVPIWDKANKTMRDTIMPGIGMYRIIADRSGKYAGQDDEEFGPERQNWGMTYPEWCKVTVYKLTPIGRVAYSAKVFWIETYAVQGRDSDAPNAMWRKRPYGQLSKCAEAQALRKAFPEVGAQPTAEEMEGKVLEGMLVESPLVGTSDAPGTTRTTRTETLKNALTARLGLATPAVEVEAPRLPPDDKTLGLVLDAIANAPTIAEAETLANDTTELGFSTDQQSIVIETLHSRIAELRFRERIESVKVSGDVKDLAKIIETHDALSPAARKVLMASARARYKQLVTAELASPPDLPTTPSQD